MTEKETFLNTWEREFQTTLKVLKAYPPDKLDLKPHERGWGPSPGAVLGLSPHGGGQGALDLRAVGRRALDVIGVAAGADGAGSAAPKAHGGCVGATPPEPHATASLRGRRSPQRGTLGSQPLASLPA